MIALLSCTAPAPRTCPDTDGDGLDDCAERAQGTDPRRADTDGDGYTDPDELAAGTDPTDPASVIYLGGWPYDRDKDALGDPGWDGVAAVGAQVPRFVGADQFGQAVDLYDLAGHGVPVVLDVSAGWCDPCRELAGWLEGSASDTFDADPAWARVRDDVDAGRVLWVTILFEDADSAPAEASFSADWAAEFANPAVPVLADPDQQLTSWLFPAAYPNLHLVSDAMVVEVYDPFGFAGVLDRLSE